MEDWVKMPQLSRRKVEEVHLFVQVMFKVLRTSQVVKAGKHGHLSQ